MHISVEKAAFVKVLSHCQNVAERKSTLPILSHILIQAAENQLSISATDLDMEFTSNVAAEVFQEGAACVSAHLLHDIIKKMRDKAVIDLEVIDGGKRLRIVSGRSRFDVGCLSIEDFPELTQTPLTHYFSLPVPVLGHLIETARPFISTDETRYNMSGIYFHCFEDENTNQPYIRAVSCDMHRLACVQCPAPEGAIGMPPAIVSRKTVHEVLKLMEDASAHVEIGISSARIEFQIISNAFSAKFTSRLIDAVFPEYSEALVVADDKKLIVNTKDFSESIDRVGSVITTGEKIRAVRLSASPTTATLSAVNQDAGSATEDFDVSFTSRETVDVCINIRYILEAAQLIKTEEMELLLQDEDSSILIRPVNDHNMTFILMPMQV